MEGLLEVGGFEQIGTRDSIAVKINRAFRSLALIPSDVQAEGQNESRSHPGRTFYFHLVHRMSTNDDELARS